MMDRFFVIADMFVCNMLHIQKPPRHTFQGKQHPCITSKICGVYMYHSASFNYWLYPLEPYGGQPAFYRRRTQTSFRAYLGNCLLTVKIHLPDVICCYFLASAETMTTRHALVSLDAFTSTILLYNGGIAYWAFFCS